MAQRMLEEHTYFCVLYLSWQRDAAWADLAPAVFGQIPQPFRAMVQVMARSSTLRDLHGQVSGSSRSPHAWHGWSVHTCMPMCACFIARGCSG